MAGFFTGLPEQTKQFQRFTPQQQGVQNDILSQLSTLLKQGQNGNSFAPIEQQARQDFTQKTIPSIAERFSSLGAQGSSAFTNSLGQAGAGLETNLASLRAGNQQNQLSQLLGYGLQPSFENLYQPETQGLLGSLGGGAGQGLGFGLPLLLGGYFGGAPAAAGGAAGSSAGSLLSGLGGTAGLGALASNPALAAGGAGIAGLAALLYYLTQRK